MKRKPYISPRRGITLLFTLMALVVLAFGITRFQLDAVLRLRASGFQREMLQCRYAAESAVIASSLRIKGILEKPIDGTNTPEGGAEGFPNPVEEISFEEAEKRIASGADPNQVLQAPAESQPENQPAAPAIPFLLSEYTMKVGETEVEVVMFDENAKWPILWLIRSPFEEVGGVPLRTVREQYQYYLQRFNTAANTSSIAADLADSLGRSLDLPPDDLRIYSAAEEQKTAPAETSRTDKNTPARGFRARWTPKNPDKRRSDEKLRRTEMGKFCQAWLKKAHQSPDHLPLIQPCQNLLREISSSSPEEPVSPEELTPTDYTGLWGHYRVNINTASPDLLFAMFAPLGLTEAMAQAIVNRRAGIPFANPSQLNMVEGLDPDVAASIQPLCIAKSDTFSLKITARRGRTHYTMTAGLYLDKNQIKTISAFAGD